MKIVFKITFLISFIVMFASCAAQKKDTNIMIINEITLKSITRGNFENIFIKNNHLSHNSPSKNKNFTLTKKDKQAIKKLISKINLETIATLKAPTEKRLYDGAMHTTISITVNGKNYTSNSFDHDAPPKQLKDLTNLLRSYLQE